MKTKKQPRYSVEQHPDGFVVVDWCRGFTASEPVPHRELADGHRAQLERLERAA